MTSTKQRPLATISRPIKAKIYRATFRPFEATKYLDAKALRSVAKTSIEIGTVEAPGVSFTLLAEIRRGMITRLKPVSCAECKPRKMGAAKLKKVAAAAKSRIEALKLPGPKLPMRLSISRTRGIIIGPIVIIIDEGIPCIWIYIGNLLCIICEFGWICD